MQSVDCSTQNMVYYILYNYAIFNATKKSKGQKTQWKRALTLEKFYI